MKDVRLLRYAIGLELVGLLLEALSILRLKPVTFLLFGGVAVPCIALGILLYLVYLLRRLARSDEDPAPVRPGA